MVLNRIDRIVVWFVCWAVTLALPVRAETFRLATASVPESWGNPYGSTSNTRLPLQSAVFDPLTRVNAAGVLMPWLVEKWQRANPTTWQLSLRENVTFSNGEIFNATAVVEALVFLKSEAGQREPIGRELADIVTARAIDARKLEVTTRVPDPLLPYRLSLLAIPAPDAWQKLGRDAFARHPIGTGPLVLEKISPARIDLKKSTTSWRRANLDDVSLLIIPEPAARRAALTTGAIDVALTTIAPSDFESVVAEGGRVFIDHVPAVVAMTFNTENFAPFKDPRVRQALTHAVNRQAIVDTIMGGQTRVASQPAGHGWFGYNDALTPLAYDPEKARQLLREAGYDKGLAFELEIPTGAVSYPDVFQAMAADLAKVGVSMSVRTIPQQMIYQNIQTGGWRGQAAAIPFSSPMFDALYPLKQHSCLWHAPWFCDVPLAENIKISLAESDATKRRAQTEAIMVQAHTKAQALYLYETVSFTGLAARVKDFVMDFGFISYESVSLKTP